VFRQVAGRFQRTRELELTGDPTRSVEVLAQRHSLNEAERIGVLRHLVSGADLSGYGLVNAVTHYSQEVSSYDRATELEALGGKLVEQSATEWKALLSPA
jgi:hypothetical protein